MSTLQDFTLPTARPLPVIILADISGSMASDGKIGVLNAAVAEMIATFADEDAAHLEIQVAVITFGGGGAGLHQPLKPASQIKWQNMGAKGGTPLGEALALATTLIENRQQIPSRAYTPTLVLISDGQPNPKDPWRDKLKALLNSDRASKAARFALAVGADADKAMLQEFLANPRTEVFEAHEASRIKDFFRLVTMSVSTRSRSSDPNQIASTDPGDYDY